MFSEPRDWSQGKALLARFCQAAVRLRSVEVRDERGERLSIDSANARAGAEALKLPKSATIKVDVAKRGDPGSKQQREHTRAVAAEVLAPLTETQAVVDAMKCGGNESVLPLAVNAVAKFEQPARALFLSNGRARSEVAGPGIS